MGIYRKKPVNRRIPHEYRLFVYRVIISWRDDPHMKIENIVICLGSLDAGTAGGRGDEAGQGAFGQVT